MPGVRPDQRTTDRRADEGSFASRRTTSRSAARRWNSCASGARRLRRVVLSGVAVGALALVAVVAVGPAELQRPLVPAATQAAAPPGPARVQGPHFMHHDPQLVRLLSFSYRAWNGSAAYAVIAVPAWYRRVGSPPLPLVITSHGRAGGPSAPVRRWRHLEAKDGFILVAPSGQGARYASYSFAVPGQIADLMRMPRLVHRAFPWIHIDRRCVYAAGSSMGGMEALMLAARYPDRIAACVSVDAVTDLAARYRVMPVSVNTGVTVQSMVRAEVGGTPQQAPLAYAVRSPLSYAGNLAFDHVPTLVYWSTRDREVILQRQQQSGRLCRRIRALNPGAPLTEIVTNLGHGGAYSFKTRLHQALDFLHPHNHWRVLPSGPPAHWQYTSPLAAASVWGCRFVTHGGRPGFWRVDVTPLTLRASSPRPLTVSVPAAAGARATVTVAGRPDVVLRSHGGRVVVHLPAGRATVRLSS